MIENILVAAAVPFFSAALFRTAPSSRRVSLEGHEYAALDRRFRQDEATLTAVGFGLIVVNGWLAYHLLVSLGPPAFPEETELLVVPAPWYWLLTSWSAAFTFTFPMLSSMTRRYFGDHFEDYLVYVDSKSGWDVQEATWRCFLLCYGVSCLLFFGGRDWYLHVGEGTLRINPFLSLGERVYDAQDVQAVTDRSHFTAPIGKVIAKRHFEVRFTDGFRFTTVGLPDGGPAHSHELARVMRRVATRAGLRVRGGDRP